MPPKSNAKTANKRPETPESLRQALKSSYIASAELVQTSKALLQSTEKLIPTNTSVHTSTDGIAKLASLIHSHTVRTALTCGLTASSPTATLHCIKGLHEPILPLVSEFQNISSEYPAYFLVSVRKEIEVLFDTMVAFLGEVVEIACGDADVESRERLQFSGMMLAVCDRIQQICKDGPVHLLREKLRETEEMLTDALEELVEVVEATGEVDDGWDEPVEYTPEQKKFAERALSKLRLLSFLYKAIAKRRIPSSMAYNTSFRVTAETIHGCFSGLCVVVDDLVSGISAQEEPMSLELSMVQILETGVKLAHATRVPLDGSTDGKEAWFDTWIEKVA